MLNIDPAVKRSLTEREPVLVLESTLISHGLPYPDNVNLMKDIFSICEGMNVQPAVIGMIKGVAKIGLNQEEIELLARADNVNKLSTRDIAMAAAGKQNGATTVAATISLAEQAGLKIFSTGGIGGVHRNFVNTLDVSADLYQLAKSSMIVISSGAKAILDLSKTLEALETLAVQVIGYRTAFFPAFYSRSSEFKIPEIRSAAEIVEIFRIGAKLGLESSVLVCNPVPDEFNIPYDEIEVYISEAVREAERKRLSGKEITPFLLQKLVSLSDGRTLHTNIALIKNNVKLGCMIAQEYYK